ncbi:hypothetical protein [Armatimonas sp.]|uniref:hypothetical protein n=1 Tax=Armatimonas sp. TaxID=1872638 RepID=UPI00286AAA87|nr:hypothetical protein [Armatimonas sp.]
MKIKILALSALALLALAGCSTKEETVVDQNAAKAQPGANTPAAAASTNTMAAQRAEKEGK